MRLVLDYNVTSIFDIARGFGDACHSEDGRVPPTPHLNTE